MHGPAPSGPGQGLAGVRLNLATGSDSVDPRCHSLLECAEDLGVPVLIRVPRGSYPGCRTWSKGSPESG
ncbi:hypothetical protein [Streptomyces sp. NPDC091217]|uniref:hypothetical protein n=1 Tax=Streptomyces sp. NPDC091217 TaxID=3365975 RepID=UPI0038267D8D